MTNATLFSAAIAWFAGYAYTRYMHAMGTSNAPDGVNGVVGHAISFTVWPVIQAIAWFNTFRAIPTYTWSERGAAVSNFAMGLLIVWFFYSNWPS